MKRYRNALVLLCSAVALLLFFAFQRNDEYHWTADRILLLLPDDTSVSDPNVTLWLDAGSEEGLHIVPIHDSDFLSPVRGEQKCAGLILPDSIHRQASDLLVAGIEKFVANGGKLMLVYDAGTLNPEGRYAPGQSRFSELAGVKYALYNELGAQTIQWNPIVSTSSTIQQFDIPPGVYYPIEPPPGSAAHSSGASSNFQVQLTRYKLGGLEYPSLTTQGTYSGRTLFYSSHALVAGERSYDKGLVLFVNLPLGYLKANTDGLLLHAFLGYFANDMLEVPSLMAVPDGVGGLVLNWHVDSRAAIEPLQELTSWSLRNQGPYSIHVTAGPDTITFGDKLGVDVEHDHLSRQLIREYESWGNAIGSHGGWIHNYFAAHVETESPEQLAPFLSMNKHALEEIVGKPVVEYSAPNGDQPQWITHWLEEHGFIGYYFTGDAGMGPTQGYRNGKRSGQNIWAFPIVHLDLAASFEELTRLHYPNSEIEDWLKGVADFSSRHHVIRLIYFHPPGILAYHQVFDHWLEETARLKAIGRFRWYTMTQMATFLNSRKQVKWKVSEQSGMLTVGATHPETLAHDTWSLPVAKYSRPVVVRGAAEVSQQEGHWMVIAGPCRQLEFQTAVNP